MSERCRYLKAVIFDWAGTMVDHGSRAPAIVFQEIFKQRGIPITAAQAREPMGRAKREHIATVAAMPEVAEKWMATFSRPCNDDDIDAMYADFLPLQKSILSQHSDLISGIPEAVATCREMGLKIGSTTGYTHELMEIVSAAARQQGYEPDCVLCSEDAPRGRPAPYLIYEAAKQLDVYPLWSMVKVDDTPVGIEAGRQAGCWTVGITQTGNCVGLSAEEISALDPAAVAQRCEQAAAQLKAAGAHYILKSAAEIVDVIRDIEQRMARGELPLP